MTKSAKRKKEKAADFTKRKLKLGKGKQPAANAVDTSFKARSIALPQQSIAVANETSAPTTKRKLTLDTLLAHLKHYGAGVRKDSLQGLQELLGGYPELIERNLSKLVNGCIRLISDEDASVRRALHSFFSWLLPRIPKDHLIPHSSTLLLFTASALSHIFPEIRLDALRLLDLLLELIPAHVVAGFRGNETGGSQTGHGRKILDGYLGLLNVGVRFGEDEGKKTGSSSVVGGQSLGLVNLSHTSKATVLNSFSKFLHHAIVQDDDRQRDSIPLWYLSGAFRSQEAFASFVDILSPRRTAEHSQRQERLWSEVDQDDCPGLYHLSDVIEDPRTGDNALDVESILAEIARLNHNDKTSEALDTSNGQLLASLCRTLHPVLVSIFLDCAPSVFSPAQASPETELELVLSLLSIARCLYGNLLRDSSISPEQREPIRRDLEALITHMTAYFPFGENSMFAHDTKVESIFGRMNLIYCELFSLLSFDHDHSTGVRDDCQTPVTKRRKLNYHSSSNDRIATMSGTSVTRQTDRVREFVIRCLHGTTSGASAIIHPLGQSLTAQSYTELLPTLWWLLDCQDSDDVSEVWKAVIHHATKAGSTSTVKPITIEFVGRLILLQAEPSYTGSFIIGSFASDDLQKGLRDWYYHLPKVLWELGDKNPTATELILLFILRLIQRCSWLNNGEIYSALCTRFAPFFTVQHATRGEIRGPFTRLDKFSSSSLPPDISLESSDPNNISIDIDIGALQAKAQTLTRINPLKKLALDVASVLVSPTSTTTTTSTAKNSQNSKNNRKNPIVPPPRKINSRTDRDASEERGEYWRPRSQLSISGLSSDPVSVTRMASSVSASASVVESFVSASVAVTTVAGAGVEEEEAQSKLNLRNAVSKAVLGMVEERYWLGVSSYIPQ